MRLNPSSTSTRTFVLVPAVVALEQALSRRPVRAGWLPLLVWGYLQHRLVGHERIRKAGGPPGMSQGFPERLVTDGIYAHIRNPMYLGHMIFLAGLTLATRSPLALAYTAGAIPWYDARAAQDEARLTEHFGEEYVRYAREVPRWVPLGPRRRPAGSAADAPPQTQPM